VQRQNRSYKFYYEIRYILEREEKEDEIYFGKPCRSKDIRQDIKKEEYIFTF